MIESADVVRNDDEHLFSKAAILTYTGIAGASLAASEAIPASYPLVAWALTWLAILAGFSAGVMGIVLLIDINTGGSE